MWERYRWDHWCCNMLSKNTRFHMTHISKYTWFSKKSINSDQWFAACLAKVNGDGVCFDAQTNNNNIRMNSCDWVYKTTDESECSEMVNIQLKLENLIQQYLTISCMFWVKWAIISHLCWNRCDISRINKFKKQTKTRQQKIRE